MSTSGLNSGVTDEFNAPGFPTRCSHFRRVTTFSATFLTIMSAHAQKCINFLLPVTIFHVVHVRMFSISGVIGHRTWSSLSHV